MRTARTPGSAFNVATWVGLNGEVISGFDLPAADTHTSVDAFTSLAALYRPLSRSLWAPWMETLPNTAIAPVAAIAIARERPARNSITAMCGTALTIVGAIRRTNASIHVSGSASNANSAPISVTIPTIAAWGAASRITSVATKHTR